MNIVFISCAKNKKEQKIAKTGRKIKEEIQRLKNQQIFKGLPNHLIEGLQKYLNYQKEDSWDQGSEDNKNKNFKTPIKPQKKISKKEFPIQRKKAWDEQKYKQEQAKIEKNYKNRQEQEKFMENVLKNLGNPEDFPGENENSEGDGNETLNNNQAQKNQYQQHNLLFKKSSNRPNSEGSKLTDEEFQKEIEEERDQKNLQNQFEELGLSNNPNQTNNTFQDKFNNLNLK